MHAPDCHGSRSLFQGKKGLRKPQVRLCFSVPKQLHSARMFGSLQRLKLLYFCSMIFGYEVPPQSKEGEGGDLSNKQRPVFLMLQAFLVLGVQSFHPAVCKNKTSIQPWSQRTSWAEVLPHQRADVKPTSTVGVQHSHPWSQDPTLAAFLPPISPFS